MAAGNFERALALVLVHEGGKSDDPHDPGGRTNWGITQTDYDGWRRQKGLVLRDVYDLDPSERDEIYRQEYWDSVQCDALPSGLDYVVFDGGVNSGPSQSVKWLQRAVPAPPVNGRMAEALLQAVTGVSDMASLITTVCAARQQFLENLSTFQYFGKGWTKRVNDVQTTALAWASGAEPNPPAAPTAPSGASQPKALRESAQPLPSTAPGDVLAAASVGAIAATVASHVTTPSATTAPAAPTPTAPSPTPAAPTPATPTPTAPGPVQPPTTVAKPVPPSAPAPSPLAPPGTPTPPSPSPAPAAKPIPAPAPAPAQAAKPVPPPAPATKPPAVITPKPLPPKPQPAVTPAPKTTVAVPPKPSGPAFSLSDHWYPIGLALLGALLLLGLFLAFSSRRARASRQDALGDTLTPSTALKVGKLVLAKAPSAPKKSPAPPAPVALPIPAVPTSVSQAASEVLSIPLVHSVYARAASVLWILLTIVVNVIMLSKLMQSVGLAHENWHEPFVALNRLYDTYAVQAFNATANSANAQFGIKLPPWLLPIFVFYVSTASAFVVASTGLLKRNTTGEALFGAVVHAGWVFAVPAFVLDAIRYHVVARFAQQNTVLFFGYLAALVVSYIAARYINDDILPGFAVQHAPGVAALLHAAEQARGEFFRGITAVG